MLETRLNSQAERALTRARQGNPCFTDRGQGGCGGADGREEVGGEPVVARHQLNRPPKVRSGDLAEPRSGMLVQEAPQSRNELSRMRHVVVPNRYANVVQQHVSDLFGTVLGLTATRRPISR